MNAKKRSNMLFVLLTIAALLLSACEPPALDAVDAYKNGTITAPELQGTLAAIALNQNGTPVPGATAVPGTAVPTTAPAGVDLSNLQPFTPDWNSLSDLCPTEEEVLTTHGLTYTMLVDNKVVDFLPNSSWEPCLTAIELKPSYYGTVISLTRGYQYTADTNQGDFLLWGGDPQVVTVTLSHGTSLRWGPTYVALDAGKWLDPNNPLELAAREYRFGRYLRDTDWADRPDNPYYSRQGSYYTHPGNLDTDGWLPPSLDATVPRDWRDACSILGGLCVESEWQFGERAQGGYLNWAWAYTNKVAGSADYCKPAEPCWQQTYHPGGAGYLEVWLSAGTTGPSGNPVQQSGPYKFYEGDQLPPVDEFSFHADPNR